MKYVIMAAGEGKRWKNHLGVPKHLLEIGGETLLARTTRLLKEAGIDDYIITGHDERYKEYGTLIPQSVNDCEIDRFEHFSEPICYLYGDVFYTREAIKTIIEAEVKDVLFLGSDQEIFAVKVKDLALFYGHKDVVKRLYLKGEVGRCIGWEVYRSIMGIPLDKHWIQGKYRYILDGTNDIDYPEDYDYLKAQMEAKAREI